MLYCMHCGVHYAYRQYIDQYGEDGTGHYEIVDTGEEEEIWYCCHICRDKDLPCETFFPLETSLLG